MYAHQYRDPCQRPLPRPARRLHARLRTGGGESARSCCPIASRSPMARTVHIGDPAQIGIKDFDNPEFGDPPVLEPGDIPVFWACGVTPQMAIRNAGARHRDHARTGPHAGHGRAGRGSITSASTRLIEGRHPQGKRSIKHRTDRLKPAFLPALPPSLSAAPRPRMTLTRSPCQSSARWSSLPLYQQFEAPFWTQTLPEMSDGQITVEMTTFNQLGFQRWGCLPPASVTVSSMSA